MKYAKAAGAIATIIYNIPGRPMVDPALMNLDAANPGVIPLALISEEDGAKLKATSGTVSMDFGRDAYSELYELLGGTSMASPHAAGVAALAWAVAPGATASAVSDAVINTAKDLGDPGVDNVYGHGLVNALEAAKKLNPAAFGSGVTPPPPPSRTGRVPGRRGR
jgi:subtilisin family serine protease